MLGATHAGSLGVGTVRMTTEDRTHPATRHLDPSFSMSDDIYRFTNWSRKRTHVLLSVDVRSLPERRRHVDGKEADTPISWCHAYGKGRVFYTAIGHRTEHYWNPTLLQFYLDGVQFATGDLKAPMEPSAPPAKAAK